MYLTHRQKQWSVLGASTLAFGANFAVWTLFSIWGIHLKSQLGLSETQFGLLIATPILTGSLARLPLGILSDLCGGRTVLLTLTLAVSIPLYALTFADQYWHYLLIGAAVGLAGGSFAAGIAYTSAWFEKARLGTALGIFGAGNTGAAVTNLVAPLIIAAYGWHALPKIYALGLLVIALVFWLLSAPEPARKKRRRLPLSQQLKPLTQMRVWRFGLYYYFVFGGFVALALWLPQYYMGQFALDLKTASFLTLALTLPAGLMRALGGWFADAFGARMLNWYVFWVGLICLFFLSYPPTTMTIHGVESDLTLHIELNLWAFTALIFVIGLAMGFGTASIYKTIHHHYPDQMGTVGATVGLIGGLGGFTLPVLFGLATDLTGIRSSCFMLLYGVLAACMILTYYAIKAENFSQRLAQARDSDFLTL